MGELCGRIKGGVFRITLEPEGATERLAALIDEALPVFEAAGDDLALYIAYSALAELAEARAQMDAALEAYEQAFAYARQAGHVPAGFLAWRAACRFFGTTPVSELLAWLDENEPRAGRDHFLRAYRAGSLAMLGRFDEARAILAEEHAELAERGGGVLLANITAFESVWIELWAGDPAAAAEFGAEGCRLHEELWGRELPAACGWEPGAGALRARPARRGRRLGQPRRGARRERRRLEGAALAAGLGQGARASRRARRGGAARARGGRSLRGDRDA